MKDINILVFGDSITYGVLDDKLGGWVNRIRLHLEEDSNNYYNIFNLGISGETSKEVLNRFEFECNSRVKSSDKNIIIIAVGINDTQDVNGKDRVSTQKFLSNIKELISKAKKITNDILFIGLTKVDESKVVPLPWNKEESYFNKKIIKFDSIIEKTCEEYNINYIKMYDVLNLNELSDGLHPNSIGHEKMFETILKEIKKMIK